MEWNNLIDKVDQNQTIVNKGGVGKLRGAAPDTVSEAARKIRLLPERLKASEKKEG